MDEADPKAGHRVPQLGQPDARTDALLNSLRLSPDSLHSDSIHSHSNPIRSFYLPPSRGNQP
jgi:hypothetical protein